MSEEKVYQFNEYVLGYDKGSKDRSCLTISKILNDNMYVMASLYDGSADVISLMLDNLQEEIKRLNKRIEDLNTINEEHRILNGMIRKQLQQKENIIKEAREYIDHYAIENEDYSKIYSVEEEDLIDILDKENK